MNRLTQLFIITASSLLFACSTEDNVPMINIQLNNNMPEIVGSDYTIVSGQLKLDEINTGAAYAFDLPAASAISVPVGVYNISGEIEMKGEDTYTLRTSAYQSSITKDETISLTWFIFNPQNTFVFGEIYFTGSLNSTGKGGLYDTYFTIYNNTDETLYADGLAIVEGKLTNVTTDLIITEANQRDANFTVQAVYVIPGNGTEVPIEPGKWIKIADQAINWTEQVANALDHRDANFEWYDESTSSSVVDTDNPSVPNLDKWFCYTKTIWIPSNQCNRSYALVRFPNDMTMDSFLANQQGDYDYISSATGKELHANNCYLIKPEWIIDGVNLCPTEKFTEPSLPASVDHGYAAISDKNADINRFGKKFVRKQSGTTGDGIIILQDTDNSANDFEIVSAK